ncbi:MAG: sialidase family protein [Thermoplasmata archaeon]
MSETGEVWILTEEGIRTPDRKPVRDIPFQGAPSVGDARERKIAIIVNRSQVWTRREGEWRRELTTDWALQCIRWTSDGRLLVGTEKARVGWVNDGPLQFSPSFDEVPERPLWNTPFGAPPAVRSLAVGAEGTLYADIHVGWIVRSRDGGKTWQSLRNGLNKDVHMVAAHPTRPGVVFAATAAGFHISTNYGEAFEQRLRGMPHYYQRACAVFPDEDVYLVSTAIHDGGESAQLYRSEDEGANWRRVEGLPDVLNRNIDTHQIAVLPGGHAFVAVDDHDLYESADGGETWTQVGADLPRIGSLLALPDG